MMIIPTPSSGLPMVDILWQVYSGKLSQPLSKSKAAYLSTTKPAYEPAFS